MGKAYDVTALGELLIDFTQNGFSEQGNPLFEANPGGAPCNVLSMLTRLGHRTAFVGKVGNDMFGRLLRESAAKQGIDMSGLMNDPEIPTTLAFVQKLANGDRDFSFYRKPGADICLTAQDGVQTDIHKPSFIVQPLAQNALFFHAAFFHDAAGGRVFGFMLGLNAVNLHFGKGIPDDLGERLGHETLIPLPAGQGIPDFRTPV